MWRPLPARLLVDLPNWLGDQVIALPAVRRLVDGNLGGETVLHCRPSLHRFLAELFPETEVVASPRKDSPVASARRLCRERGRFEIGVTLRNAARAKILVRLAATCSVGSRGEGAGLLLSRRCEVDRRRHQVFDADSILGALGLASVNPIWRPRRPMILDREGVLSLARLGMQERPVVGLAPATARGQAKRWPAARFGLLARRLAESDLRTLVLIGAGEEKIAEEVRAAAEFDLPIVGPDRDVAGLAAIVSQLTALVGNDSGAMHLAACFGTPVVALFGPSDPTRTAPVGGRHEVLCQNLACAPCTAPSCPLLHHECLRGLSVDDVEEALMRIVDSPRPGGGSLRPVVASRRLLISW
jgi:heptosyltransferase-2